MRQLLTTILVLLISLSVREHAFGQERCETVEYMQQLRNLGKLPQTDDQFEQWLSRKRDLQRRLLLQQGETQRQQGGPYQIPVVVHVIHNGEPVGTGTNISDAQVYSQLAVINDDFKRLNADAANTPAEFLPVAGSMDIEFVLAKSDPNGLCTNGIVRVQGSKSSWSRVPDDATLKSQSYWPSEHYLNIWVADLSGLSLGYAQFPVSNLEGLEEYQNGLAQTDGVVIDYEAFGSDDYGSFDLEPDYNKGRTTTHELGHFFGLRHIWGDETCGTDYVDDTPQQHSSTTSCPAHPQSSICTSPITKMFQNFMDYTDDACMNILTQGQVERMEFILNDPTVPRRMSLLASPGLVTPAVCERIDVAISRINSPTPISCATTAPLSITILNRSDVELNSITLSYAVNQLMQSGQVLALVPALASGASRTLTLAPDVNLTTGTNTIYLEITEANGEPDEDPSNSFVNATVLVDPSTDYLPLRQRFDLLNWPAVSPLGGVEWELVSTNFGNSATVQAFNQGIVGEEVWLATPVLDFSNISKASMFFDYSYAFNGFDTDRLNVLISTDCGASYQPLAPAFNKAGAQLAIENSNQSWLPSSRNDWFVKQNDPFVNLSGFSGEEQIRLAFVFTNATGNNLYLDNIEFFLDDEPFPPEVEEPYAIYWKNNLEATITFNLAERQAIGIYVVDVMGREFINTTATGILNQTFPVDLGNVASGIYLMRVQVGNRFYASKFYLSR
ncbi:M43 family zinc metalloprotease [Oscillatoria amoena NRMC-F 0135]|nr:M43 family zinc metalloprotease [Oscillatoria amoena NRMC-F 0135]